MFAILAGKPYRMGSHPDETMRWVLPLAIACICTPISAQEPIPDTTEVWRYFPLGNGDVWEYRVEIEFVPPNCFPSCVQFWRRAVVGDSTIGGFTYRKIRLKKFTLNGHQIDSSEEFYRLDTLSAEIRQPTGNGEQAYGGTSCGLDSPFPPEKEELECGFGGAVRVTGEGYESQVLISGDAIVAPVKSFWNYPTGNFRFAADIGMVLNEEGKLKSAALELIYANVGGVEYGTPFPVSVEPETPGPSNLSISAGYPNPVTEQFSVDLTLGTPATIAIVVFDSLGRRIHSGVQVVSAGRTTIPIDASGWPSGLYLVRATTAAGQKTATTRITRQ